MEHYSINPSDVLKLEEPMSAYGIHLINACRNGISKADFMEFVKKVGESIQSLAEIMPSSYSSLTKKNVYDRETSERILELAQLYAYGQEVFGSLHKFRHWLHKSSIALGGNTPFSLLDTSFGFHMVRDEIGRIDHGIF